jgi:hypothetical protein
MVVMQVEDEYQSRSVRAVGQAVMSSLLSFRRDSTMWSDYDDDERNDEMPQTGRQIMSIAIEGLPAVTA